MPVRLSVVGRMRQGPELTLIRDYLERFDRLGRGLGLGPSEVVEVETGGHPNRSVEARRLRGVIPKSAWIIALDETGRMLTSDGFARMLDEWRQDGCSRVAILIGGADGLHSSLLKEARATIAFGRMVWPHMLCRVMVAEQLYRAASILAGTAYHRGRREQ
ncbi:MAG: 23S rRNA (pseudouridine(1915)-N(3))-methyltransferase RlmH [Paracoccaceae bacterium]|nr:23S rRNA (pseudouridine(1915)-N(3))-methyltransferase RlmH [Paracoccaceae bacterium]